MAIGQASGGHHFCDGFMVRIRKQYSKLSLVVPFKMVITRQRTPDPGTNRANAGEI